MRRNNVVLRDVELAFRNFAGNEGEFNRKGDRNFSILLRPEEAEGLEQDGWNVKFLKVREEGDLPQPYLQVSVSYNPKAQPPKIVMITSRAANILPEDLIEGLDYVDIQRVDVTLNPYDWNVSGKAGRKAYLKTMYITILEDPLDLEYAELMMEKKAIAASWNDGEVIQGELVDERQAIEF